MEEDEEDMGEEEVVKEKGRRGRRMRRTWERRRW